MGWIVRDFSCPKCSHFWEDTVDTKNQTSTCAKCGATDVPYTFGAAGIASFSIMNKEQRTEHMKQRSEKHTKEMMRKQR